MTTDTSVRTRRKRLNMCFRCQVACPRRSDLGSTGGGVNESQVSLTDCLEVIVAIFLQRRPRGPLKTSKEKRSPWMECRGGIQDGPRSERGQQFQYAASPKTCYPHVSSDRSPCRRRTVRLGLNIGGSRPTRSPHTPDTPGMWSLPPAPRFSSLQLHRTPHTQLACVRYTLGKTASWEYVGG